MNDNEDVTPVEVELDGTRLYIEAVTGLGDEQQVSNQVVESLQTALDSMKAIGERVAQAAQAIEPDHFSVELGFSFRLEQGVLVAMLVKGSGTASVTVNLQWDRHKAKDGTG